MARVVPFRALRYGPDHREEMGLLAAPPYDVISEPDRLELQSLHPRNVVRLILPGEAGQVEDGSFYTGAADLLARWEREGTLQRDPVAAFYPYRQTFREPGGERVARMGFFGALALPQEGKGAGEVLLHERTLDKPRQDRTRLIQACRANLSAIFLLHPDTTGVAEATIQELVGVPSLFAFEDAAGVRHEMWKLEDSHSVDRLQESLARDWTFIADGHHRYESAMEVRRLLPGEPGAGHVLAFFCSLKDRGFRILPIHRLWQASSPGPMQDLVEALRQRHSVEMLSPDLEVGELLRRLKGEGDGTFAVVTGDRPPFLLRIAAGPADSSDPLSQFDTLVLQRRVFNEVLHLSDRDLSAGAIRYTSDAGEAVRQVRSGQVRAAFLLNPLKVDAVVRAAQLGFRLPQKSTYFYPKVFTGLVIRPF